jgi:catechol 2,3-dioxygenase-like lactoylglutathione lyase family enzyme
VNLIRTVPAFPVRDVRAAGSFYVHQLGFEVLHEEDQFAIVRRDQAELHLWAASDDHWRERSNLANEPICSGAESFIAGTASCQIQTDDIEAVYREMREAGVLHPNDPGQATDTPWGTRDFAVLDLDGNLITFFQRRSAPLT